MSHYSYFKGATSFSIFDTMSKMLDERGVAEWGKKQQTTASSPLDVSSVAKCNLVLGDRFDIPYHMFRNGQSGTTTSKPLLNYFKGSHKLTLKASMAKLLREIPELKDSMPQSFVIGSVNPASPSSIESEVKALKRKPSSKFALFAAQQRSKIKKNAGQDELEQLQKAMIDNPDAIWIVKPSAGCKGKGIFLTKSFSEIVRLVQPTSEGTTPSDSPSVPSPTTSTFSDPATEEGEEPSSGVYAVQRYIPNPLLLPGNRKFDIRVWALLAPPFNVYVFNQGSCRTTCTPFSLENIDDPMVHLTNHDLQQHSKNYGQFEQGNEMWYSALDRYIREKYNKKGEDEEEITFDSHVKPKILQLVARCLCAVKDVMEVPDYEPFRCFQLFGFDLLIDDQLKVHLIEINGSPGAAQRWLEPMVHGMLDLVIDKEFPLQTEQALTAKAQQLERIKLMEKKDGEVAGWDVAWRVGDVFPISQPQPVAEDGDTPVLVSKKCAGKKNISERPAATDEVLSPVDVNKRE